MGHKFGKEYRKLHQDYMNGKISKEKFLEEYRNPSNYQPQSRRTNRGNNTQYNNNAEYSMAAVLNAITGGKDFSNGAIRWDGFDLAIKGWEHVKSKNQGLGISRSHYQTFYSYWAGGNRLKNASGNPNAIFSKC